MPLSPGAYPPSFLGLEGPFRDYTPQQPWPYWFKVYCSFFSDFVHPMAGAWIHLNGRQAAQPGVEFGHEDCAVTRVDDYTVSFIWKSWSSWLDQIELRNIELGNMTAYYNTGRWTNPSGYYPYSFVWATTMGAPFMQAVSAPIPVVDPFNSQFFLYDRQISLSFPVRPGLHPVRVNIKYRLNDQPTVYDALYQWVPAQRPTAIPGTDVVETTIPFMNWSEKTRFASMNITSVQFSMQVVYDEADVIGNWSSEYHMSSPGNVPTLSFVNWFKTGDPLDPFYMIYRLSSTLPYNAIAWETSYNGNGSFPRSGRLGVGTNGAGSTVDWPNGEAAFEWVTQDIRSETIRVKTDLDTTLTSGWSVPITAATPLIWPYVLEPSYQVQHVREVIVSWLARNYGRPTKVGTFDDAPGQIPVTWIPWSETSEPEWGDGPISLSAGTFADGPVSLSVSSAAMIEDVEWWAWAAGLFHTFTGIAIETQPVLQTIYIEATPDRVGARVTSQWQLTCPGSGTEIEFQRGEGGVWEHMQIRGADVFGGADTDHVGDVVTWYDDYVMTELGTYYYRMRSFYASSLSLVTYGEWSEIASQAVDVNFEIYANELDRTWHGYEKVELIATYFVELVGQPVEFLTLWTRPDDTAVWTAREEVAANIDQMPVVWQAHSSIVTVARNSRFMFTFTDGRRPPNDDDKWAWLISDDSIGMVVEPVQMEAEDEFA